MDKATQTIWIRISKKEKDAFKKICKDKFGEPMSRIFREQLLQPFIKKNGGK